MIAKERIYTLFQLAEDSPANEPMVLTAGEVLDLAALALEVHPELPTDHVFRDMVNELRDVAQTYHAAGQLRAQIVKTLRKRLNVG